MVEVPVERLSQRMERATGVLLGEDLRRRRTVEGRCPVASNGDVEDEPVRGRGSRVAAPLVQSGAGVQVELEGHFTGRQSPAVVDHELELAGGAGKPAVGQATGKPLLALV